MSEIERLRKNVFDNLQEIERLNNIIDGIETYCNIAIGMNFNMNNNELQNQIVEDYTKMLDKLKELKGE